jgi:hypothetical protein
MAFGILSGKFLTEKKSTQELTYFQFARYNSAQCAEATKLYQELRVKMEL